MDKTEERIIKQLSKELNLPDKVIDSIIKSTNRFIIEEMKVGSINEIDELQTICLPVLGKFIPKRNLKAWKKKNI
jgi:hypothetical protein